MAETFLMYGPTAATLVAAYALYSGLREPSKVGWWEIGLGSLLLTCVWYLVFFMASQGRIGPVAAILVGLPAGVVGLMAGILMLWKLPKWRKAVALIFVPLFPMLLNYGIGIGDDQSPESLTRRNADLIIIALGNYHADRAIYPEDLASLTPNYLDVIPAALTTQGTGWLYQSTGESFTLGYWYWPQRWGTLVCIYESLSRTWKCGPDQWSPFRPIPTP